MTAADLRDNGLTLYIHGRRSEALILFQSAVLLAPENAFGHFLLALAMTAQKRSEEARQEWQAMLRTTNKGEVPAWAIDLALTSLSRPSIPQKRTVGTE